MFAQTLSEVIDEKQRLSENERAVVRRVAQGIIDLPFVRDSWYWDAAELALADAAKAAAAWVLHSTDCTGAKRMHATLLEMASTLTRDQPGKSSIDAGIDREQGLVWKRNKAMLAELEIALGIEATELPHIGRTAGGRSHRKPCEYDDRGRYCAYS